ncbi:MAG: hypothetical protein U0359_29005 [Byssovorax sp.]
MRAARAFAALLAPCLLWACAAGTEAGPASSSTGGGSGTTTGTGGGGAAPTGDALPSGAVSFFRGPSCPEGWKPFDAAGGRFLLPTLGAAAGGTKYGDPLASGEDRAHTHAIKGSFNVPSTSFAGVAGGGNHGVGVAGVVPFATTSDPASTNLPYLQLLVCRKAAEAAPRMTPLPHGMMVYFDTPTCPAGWKQAEDTQGRFPVGLPKDAPADLSFGGAPLSGPDARAHGHGKSAVLKTESHGIALASGCCGDGYAGNGMYIAGENTDESETGLPYIELLHCQVP